ncbi:MAG TPA: hypothetical protein VFX60_01205 [Micromonospora sp.]|nr:hypothetical protein [Micromonospora sp.]
MTYPPYGGSDQPPGGPPQQDPWQQPVPPQPSQPPAYGLPGQPAPGAPIPGQQFPGTDSGPAGYPSPGQAGPPPAGHPGYPPYGPPGYPPYGAPAPKKRRGLLVVSLVLAAALLLCGGGGVGAFLLLRNTENGEGAAEPVVAVEEFLEAVYQDRDVEKAASLVCSAARDRKAISKKIAEVEEYATQYDKPRFRWDKPKIDDQNKERTIVSVELTMVTGDEKTAEQKLVFTVVQRTGWWVCEVG